MAARKKKKKKKRKSKSKRKAAGRDILCVGSKVKAYIKSKGFKCSGELVGSLSEHVHEALDAAMSRCDSNKRSTVRPADL